MLGDPHWRAQSKGNGKRVQLHRALSKLGCGSRKQAWAWIQAGEVSVDGRTETDPLAWVDLAQNKIERLGHRPRPKLRIVLALHKPRGIVTTRSDERGRRTVYDLLPPNVPWLFPAGRLDADSEGLLIMTNDSRLAVRLTDPEGHVPKTYEVKLREPPSEAVLAKLRRGLTLSDGPTRPARVRVLDVGPRQTVIEMTLTEGRNRQIRRMWAALAHKVLRLKRVAIGPLRLGDLPPGHIRELNARELHRLAAPGKDQDD